MIEHEHNLAGCLPDQNSNQCLRVDQIYRQIKSLTDLTPSARVNYLFSSLVTHALNPNLKYDLSTEEVDDLQRLCSLGEYQLEKFWARDIINSNDPEHTLAQFTYYQNYQKLTGLEYSKLMDCAAVKGRGRWLFIGGGPLPLTAILLARDYKIDIKILDLDKEAINLSRAVIDQLSLAEKIEIVESSGEDYDQFGQHEIVFVAALAGVEDQTKRNIFQRIAQDAKSGTYLLARSSYGNRRLLYKPVSFTSMVGFEKVLEFHPTDEVVNSILIARSI